MKISRTIKESRKRHMTKYLKRRTTSAPISIFLADKPSILAKMGHGLTLYSTLTKLSFLNYQIFRGEKNELLPSVYYNQSLLSKPIKGHIVKRGVLKNN